jgi:hypothetical protein
MLAYGVQEHRIEGVSVRIFSSAKTVADCFRYRNKIGLDVALEALRECIRKRRATSDELWQAAKVCRVANVMRPYLESLSGCEEIQFQYSLAFPYRRSLISGGHKHNEGHTNRGLRQYRGR